MQILWKTISFSWNILSTKQRKQAVLALLFMLLNTVLEVFSLIALLSVVLALLQQQPLEKFMFLSKLYEFLKIADQTTFSWIILGGLFVFFAFKNLISGYFTQYYTSLGFKIAMDLSEKAYRGYFQLSYLAYTEKNTAIATKEVFYSPNEYANAVLTPLLYLISELFLVTGILVGMLFYQWQLVALLMVVFLPVLAGVYYYRYRQLKTLGEEMHQQFNENVKRLGQGIDAYVYAKINHSEEYFIKRFSETNRSLFNAYIFTNTLKSFTPKITEILVVGVVMLVTGYVILYQKEGNILELMGVLALAAYRVMPSFNKIIQYFTHIRTHYGVIHDLKSINVDFSEQAQTDNLEFQQIAMNQVAFAYPQTSNCLQNISLKINKGSKTGIVGESGSGKTTLIHLLTGFLEPSSGTILLNGNSLTAQNKASWQQKIGYVSQNALILDMTLAENIALGEKKDKVNYSRIWQILEKLKLYDWAKVLPKGLDTMVGENGLKISGGQKQRIALARMLYQDKEIWILDEITNQLDKQTETEIKDFLKELANDEITIIIISHDKVLLEICSEVYALKAGSLQILPEYIPVKADL